MRIIIRKRANDYIAFIEGMEECWGCGKTPNQAIGDLIASRADAVRISCIYEF